MKTYEELVRRYRKRRRDNVFDAAAAGLTYADEIAAEAGVLVDNDLFADAADAVGMALPFIIIAVTEGSRVLAKRKPAATGLRDGAYRMAKTAAALGVGSAAASMAGLWAAVPTAVGVRVLLDRSRSRIFTGRRVQGRIDRLRALNDAMAQQQTGNLAESIPPERIPAEIVEA